ncbi:MAG: DUF1045 domain-containing protein [Pseudomonadota bacterium]
MEFARYAIYYTPPEGPFSDFGASWLGWDPIAGTAVQHPATAEQLDIAEITARPRKYGFHGTLKAPFRLADGATRADLETAVAALAAHLRPAFTGPLRLHSLDGFLALIPTGDTVALAEFAATVVRDLDTFRAPLSEDDLARRRAAPLTPRQDEYLVAWGYPYIMEDFRFHMTLSRRLDEATAATAKTVLEPLVAPHIGEPFQADALTLLGEGPDGRFRQLHRYTLAG